MWCSSDRVVRSIHEATGFRHLYSAGAAMVSPFEACLIPMPLLFSGIDREMDRAFHQERSGGNWRKLATLRRVSHCTISCLFRGGGAALADVSFGSTRCGVRLASWCSRK